MAEKIKHLETNYIKQSELNFIIILNNDDEVKKFNELTKEKLTRPCIITINNGCVCTSNLAELSFLSRSRFYSVGDEKRAGR